MRPDVCRRHTMSGQHLCIAVLGNSGSGKSTLARWFAQRTGAAMLDLDTVAWEPDQVAVQRSEAAACADVEAFCRGNERWVIEGCYAGLVGAALGFRPGLVFLNPGSDQCVANCRERPWEPHKHASRQEQDQRLEFLLSWVRDYYFRDGDMSLSGHRACFEAYAGPKWELTSPVTFEPPGPELLACLGITGETQP